MKTNGNEPAQPTTEWGYKGDEEHGWVTIYGLTKREQFAAMAMQGLLSQYPSGSQVKDVGEMSVNMADALIEALNKESEAGNE